MNHSDPGNSLPLAASTSIASDAVNQAQFATLRCPTPQKFDPRCETTASIMVPPHTQQITDACDDLQAAISNQQSPLCPPMTLTCPTQPLSRRTLRYLRRNNRCTADDEPLFSASDRSKTIVPTVGASNYSTLEFPAQMQVLKLGDVPEINRCPPEPAPKLYTPCVPPMPPSSLRANLQPTSKMSAKTKNAMTTSAAQPTSPLATTGTDSVTASPSAPLLLRAAAHPGHDRAWNQRPSSPVASSLAAPPAHLSAFAPFWDTSPADAKRKMLGMPFHELEKSVEAAKAEAASTAIQLADDEYLKKHNVLVEDETKITAAFDENNATLASLERHVQECHIRGEALGIKQHSAVEAVHASARAHTKYKAGLLTAPPSRPQRAYSTSNMPPRHREPRLTPYTTPVWNGPLP